MAPPSKIILADDEEQNGAVVRWVSQRLRRVRLGEAPPLALPPDLNEADREDSYREWAEIEIHWGKTPNSKELVKAVNDWIEKYLPSGNQPAGWERQKMMTSLRSIRANRKRRDEGGLRFELDTEVSSKISQIGVPLVPLLEASLLRGRTTVETLLIRRALDMVLSDSALTKIIFDQVGKELSARKR